jgi:hypothetical protein
LGQTSTFFDIKGFRITKEPVKHGKGIYLNNLIFDNIFIEYYASKSLSENRSWYPTENICSLKINHVLDQH